MVYLVRHPQSEANVLNINGRIDGELTKYGQWQAKSTANFLANLEISKILTSPALRCVYLAEKINRYHGVTIDKISDLRERDYGELEGQAGSKIFELGIRGRPQNGESVIDVYNRAAKIRRDYNFDDKTLILSHGLFLKMFAAQMLDLDLKHSFKILKFSNCGISNIKPSLIEFLNSRSHLKNSINKIHIFGCWAAGKTTLSVQLGKLFGLPLYHLDEIKYPCGFFEERSVNERIQILEKVTSNHKWITEGAWTNYASNAFSRSDLLIYCDVPKKVALENAIKRQKSRHDLPGVSLDKLLIEIDKYYDTSQEISKKSHDFIFEKYHLKSIKSSDISFEDVEFLEDLWKYLRD